MWGICLWRVASGLHWGVAPVIVALIIAMTIVKVPAVAKISETTIISEATIIPWGIVAVIPGGVVVILMTVPVLVCVVCLIGVATWLSMILVSLIVTHCRGENRPWEESVDGVREPDLTHGHMFDIFTYIVKYRSAM